MFRLLLHYLCFVCCIILKKSHSLRPIAVACWCAVECAEAYATGTAKAPAARARAAPGEGAAAAEAALEQQEAGKAPTDPVARAALGARAPQGRINDFCTNVNAYQYDRIIAMMAEILKQLPNWRLLLMLLIPTANE
jgi:hypothetical protein